MTDTVPDDLLAWAVRLVAAGADLMTVEQISKWEGCRAFLELAEESLAAAPKHASGVQEQIDMRCLCMRCQERTQETYTLPAYCTNCDWVGSALLRKGDEPSTGQDCPKCGVSFRLQFRRLPASEPPRCAPEQQWHPIETAPKDGTRIVAWCVHPTAEYAKDAVNEGWSAPVVARWIDHNGGGWTWHGHLGEFTHWMPLPPPPTNGESARCAPEPIPMLLRCASCHFPHVDEGEWAARPHRTHQCQKCGHKWRPANVPTVGVVELPPPPAESA